MQPLLNSLGELFKALLSALQNFLSKKSISPVTPQPVPVVVTTQPPPVVVPPVTPTPVIIPEPTPETPPNTNTGFLICPIKGVDNQGQPLNSRTVKISAVIDHSGTALDPASTNRWGKSAKDQKVKAFNGEIGSGEQSAGTAPFGYAKNPATPFFASGEINYVGAASSDGARAKSFLNYDGHAGYDYPYSKSTPVVAAAGGTLYKLQNSEDTTYGQGWPVHHTFVINHGNGYSTSYRHCDKLADDVEAQIGNDFNKPATVKAGQVVGYVGSFGAGAAVHLHFEVHGKKGAIIDPYADKLWED